ncbi:hypothetical protein SPRG_01128 [Saprolegnia parasitica CBS 223.65]|uniref:HTH myb-type domain-containing protein n=1 Tax=Saprolegnia parasitica (strain CBS 223.65) TaxID=695850 RepID=A0A067CWI3_SAPPC|nr:hypothetical protein SPRG_01128 [Saprolegnia parasitica CBS 223.65]KDO35064.1 hypothetical protein SPRG_01128 [Saprolegnia parasitica CBS 223.65]|eukprot:XP_012194717.1 hypothetical protein SPRG_01128 [Saprolegnia parasitica CBS 223.65]
MLTPATTPRDDPSKKRRRPETTTNAVPGQGPWTNEEHERFLLGIRLFPEGPWKAVAEFVQTRNAKQTQTHMQKCKEKMLRKLRTMDINVDDVSAAYDASTKAMGTIKTFKQLHYKQCEDAKLPDVHPIPFDPTKTPATDDAIELHVFASIANMMNFDECLDFFLDDMAPALLGDDDDAY